MTKIYSKPVTPKPVGPACRRTYCTLDDYAGSEREFLENAAEGSIWKCDICGRYWHMATHSFSDDGNYWKSTWWYEVRWYHFHIRKLIKELATLHD